MPGGLVGAEVAAVAEHGEQVAPDGLGELRVGAGGRAEVTGVAGPVLGVLEDVEQVALRHAGADLLLELGQPGGRRAALQLLQVRCPVGGNAEFGVVGEAGIHLGGERRQLGPQRGREVLAPFGDAEGGAVGRQPRLALRPRQELGAVVGEGLGALDVEVAGLQGVGQVDEHAHLERAPVENDAPGPAPGDEALPALGGEAEIDVARDLVAAGVAVPAHDRQRLQQAAVLGRRSDVHQVEQPEQQDAVLGVDGPEQRQIVAPVPGRHGLALPGQRLDAALLRKSALTWRPKAASVSSACAVSSTWPKTPIKASSMARCCSCKTSSRSLAAAWVRRMRRSIISISSSRQRMRAWRSRASSRACRLPGWAMSRRSLTSSAAASAANWRSLVWAMPSRSGSGSIRPPSQSRRSVQRPIVFGVAGPGPASGG